MCARYCDVAPSTPGMLGDGDDSGREIQERQKPAGLGIAGFLLGGMNFLRLSNPPGSDRRVSRPWP